MVAKETRREDASDNGEAKNKEGMRTLTKLFVLFLLVMNLIAFGAMGIDKKRAQKHRWRIPETTLFLWVLLGGGIGGILGMQLFHHKTRRRYFRIGFPLICILEYGALAYWIWK